MWFCLPIYPFSVQLEELLEPYLKDTDLGLPYWNWTKNSTVPDLWEDVYSPIKDYKHQNFSRYKLGDFSICQNKFQGSTLKKIPCTNNLEIRGFRCGEHGD